MERTIEVGGVQRRFILDVPETIAPHHPVPVLLDYHGFGHSAAGVWKVSRFRDLAAQEKFITVYPDGLNVHLLERDAPGWQLSRLEGNRDLEFTARILDTIEQQYCVDRARVYSTGFSNGAFFSHLLGCEMSDRIAAIAPVSGGALRNACHPKRAVPAIIFHGRKDDLVKVERGRELRDFWRNHNGCAGQPTASTCERFESCRDGANVEYCENDGAHHWPVEATERIWRFLSAQRMSGL